MKILFVCLGNICRSPSAEGVLRKLAAEHHPDLDLTIDSAGTHDYHTGKPPDRRSIEAASRRGIDISNLRARTVRDEDFTEFDLVLAMDRSNLAELHSRSPALYRERVRLLMEFSPGSETEEVPDPYYGGENAFEAVLDLLEEAAEGLLQTVVAPQGQRRC